MNQFHSKRSHFKCSLLLTGAVLLTASFAATSHAQMVTGADMGDYDATFGVQAKRALPFDAVLAQSSAPGNVLFPGEQPRFVLQISNNGKTALQTPAKIEVLAYGTRGLPGDIWKPQTFRVGVIASAPFTANIAPGGFQNVTIAPRIPARFGAYALVADMGEGRRQFVTSFVRTFKAETRRVQYPSFCLDELPPDVLKRLGVQAIRWGLSYKPTTDKDFPRWFAEQNARLQEYKKANVAVLAMIGGGDFMHPNQPLGRPRPWLSDKGEMLDTKFDLAWLPSYDADFQHFTQMFATQQGWPRGPVNAFSLWNEPREGISISGWGADMLRYREMYRHMARGVLDARKTGVQVLVGGTDSSSNAFDKLFADGTKEFLPIFDFLSVHYQGLSSMANVKMWRNRKGYNGRVRIWDTESWVANTDDRLAALVASNRAAGYDRAMGIYGGNIVDERRVRVRQNDGTTREVSAVTTWSPAAAIGASQHFIGERPFKRMLFENGLPWVMQFDSASGGADDGTLVVVGDLGEEFGADNLLFRTARGLAELRHKAALRAQLAKPNLTVAQRKQLQTKLNTPETLSGASMSIAAHGSDFGLYDFYGNAIPTRNGKIVVPLDGRGFFLRASGKPGSFARLVAATRNSHVSGIEPLATVARDMTERVAAKPTLMLELTNVLNRPVRGKLALQLAGLQVAYPTQLAFAPNETKMVPVKVIGGRERADNNYALNLAFNAGRDGVALHGETMHVNSIARRAIKVDGDLRDWSGTTPQIVRGGTSGPSTTEAAWFSFKPFAPIVKNGLATGYAAYDANNFYFAAKIADSTPEAGMVRTATRNDDDYFYPKLSYQKPDNSMSSFAARWSGDIEAPTAGTYAFSTLSDDGVRLFIDDKAVIDNWTDHGPVTDRAEVQLTPGRHAMRLEYFNSAGAGRIQLSWQPPNAEMQPIPAGALFPQNMNSGINGAVVGDGLRGEYFVTRDFAGKALATRLDSGVNFTYKSGQLPDPAFANLPPTPLTWPDGVRRYSYRKDPELPAGNAPNHDNAQIAFNVLPQSQKPWLSKLPGVPDKFTNYKDTDYEYALNPIAPQYGSGVEVWRLEYPGMPRKHFYPRQPKSPFDGPVVGARLVVKREGNTRLVEAAIPWREIPAVRAAMEKHQPVKFSFRVNDNAGAGTMELSRERSVAKRNASFHVDWVEHWANELSFGWEDPVSKPVQRR